MAETSTHAGFLTWTREAQIALQPDGTVVAWNPAAARLLQIPADAAIGHPLTELLPDLANLLTTGSAIPSPAAPAWQRRTLTLRDGAELVVEHAATWHDWSLLLILAWAARWQQRSALPRPPTSSTARCWTPYRSASPSSHCATSNTPRCTSTIGVSR